MVLLVLFLVVLLVLFLLVLLLGLVGLFLVVLVVGLVALVANPLLRCRGIVWGATRRLCWRSRKDAEWIGATRQRQAGRRKKSTRATRMRTRYRRPPPLHPQHMRGRRACRRRLDGRGLATLSAPRRSSILALAVRQQGMVAPRAARGSKAQASGVGRSKR